MDALQGHADKYKMSVANMIAQGGCWVVVRLHVTMSLKHLCVFYIY